MSEPVRGLKQANRGGRRLLRYIVSKAVRVWVDVAVGAEERERIEVKSRIRG
jgi:hypothetical protein